MPEEKAILLAFVAATRLDATDARNTSECFIDSQFTVDPHLYVWLPPMQLATPAAIITVFSPQRVATYTDWTKALLGISPDATIRELGASLINQRYVMTLSQFETMLIEAADGARNGIRTDGVSNFCFVVTRTGRVGICSASYEEAVWFVTIHKMEYDFTWPPNRRLLVPHLTAKKRRH